MKKILTTIAALAYAVQAWGETVSYVDESGVTQQADATVIVASGSRVTWAAGWYVVNSTVTINGGTVTATGGNWGGYGGAGIGGGYDGSASNVKVDPLALIVKANGTVVANDGGDLAAALRGKSFVVIMPSTVPVGDGLAATFADGVCTVSGEGAMSEHAPLMGDDSTDGMLEL